MHKQPFVGAAPIVLVVMLLAPGSTSGADRYFVGDVTDLEFVGDGLASNVEANTQPWRSWRRGQAMVPYAVLDGGGEVYVTGWNRRHGREMQATVAVLVDDGQPPSGRLFVANPDYTGMVQLPFKLPSKSRDSDRQREFLQQKLAYYDNLLVQDIPGAAWFRHQSRELRKQLDEKQQNPRTGQRRFFGRNRNNELQDTYALVSGGRAVSENLQLDRVLPEADARDGTSVPLDTIEGITVREFDWQSLIEKGEPAKDPLAALIPLDQHAVFFPSFQSLVAVADNAESLGATILALAEPRAEHAQTRERYERQLGLSLGTVARLVGPQLIRSVAMTGGDPYLRTGSDVAVLFEAHDASTLRKLIESQIALAAQKYPEARPVQTEIAGVPCTGMRSPDRVVCSYLVTLGSAVVVSNSPAQLERLIATHSGKITPLAALPEYDFFRQRYPLNDPRESALVLLTDATIRRWCGPRWRIATSRRTQATAVMAELQAAHLDQLVKGDVQPSPVTTPLALPGTSQLAIASGGISSDTYGSLLYQTPIGEMELDEVTKSEADLYKQWRDGYQRYWNNFFDPIAARLTVTKDKLAVDLTVMPLIDMSDYRTFVEVSQGATIDPADGDPHPATLLHWALAVNTKSPLLQQQTNLLRAFAPQVQVNPLSWIDDTIAVYVDDDPLWQELATAEEADIENYVQKHLHRLPVALYVNVKSGIKLTAFLAGVRAFIEQTAPEMTVWENLKHNDEPYVKITPSQRARNQDDDIENLALCYSASGESLIVTLSEDVLKRALDRQPRRGQDGNNGQQPTREGPPWLGENLCLQVNQQFMQLLAAVSRGQYQQRMQVLAWGNLPILNEWQRRYPDHDPAQLHAQLWHRQLVCPGGGQYRWNDQWQTMESTVYGHPGQPQDGPELPAAVEQLLSGNFGLTFQDHGLRARVELLRDTSR